MRTGYAQLPLHGGKAPAWLFSRMVPLPREMMGHVVAEYGSDEVLLHALDRLPALVLPDHHDVRGADIDRRYLHKILLKTYDRAPEDFETLLGLPGVGAKTLRALALASELIYGTRASTRDPARFSFAHGGKDGFPYPVDRETYDRTIEVLGAAVRRASVAHSEKVQALKRLAAFADQPLRPSSSSTAANDRRSISS